MKRKSKKFYLFFILGIFIIGSTGYLIYYWILSEGCQDGRGTDYYFEESKLLEFANRSQFILSENDIIAKSWQSCSIVRWEIKVGKNLEKVDYNRFIEYLDKHNSNCADCLLVQKFGFPYNGEIYRLSTNQQINITHYTQNETVELPKEIVVEKNVTELCKLVFGSVVISFDRDCISMNITDSLTKQPIQNATVKLAIYGICVGFCKPEIISEKQTNELGFVVFYKDEILNHSAIKRGGKINTIIIDAKGYNATEKTFDYEYNQIINFELEPNVDYCKKNEDCVLVISGCRYCPSCRSFKITDPEVIAVNENLYKCPLRPKDITCILCVDSFEFDSNGDAICINNKCEKKINKNIPIQ